MSEPDYVTFLAAFFLLCIGLIFSPTRAVIAFVFNLAWDLLMKVFGMLFTASHEIGREVWEAHMVWVKNWKPRNTVIPSVRAEKSTRRL